MATVCFVPLSSRQPLQNHPSGHLGRGEWGGVGGWGGGATPWSAEEILDGQYQTVDIPPDGRTAHSSPLARPQGIKKIQKLNLNAILDTFYPGLNLLLLLNLHPPLSVSLSSLQNHHHCHITLFFLITIVVVAMVKASVSNRIHNYKWYDSFYPLFQAWYDS